MAIEEYTELEDYTEQCSAAQAEEDHSKSHG